jgi:hypothetical protein
VGELSDMSTAQVNSLLIAIAAVENNNKKGMPVYEKVEFVQQHKATIGHSKITESWTELLSMISKADLEMLSEFFGEEVPKKVRRSKKADVVLWFVQKYTLRLDDMLIEKRMATPLTAWGSESDKVAVQIQLRSIVDALKVNSN